jgi:solute carrier family 45 protein 1/2/4
VGETYFRYEVPKDAEKSKDVLGEVGRMGSLSLVIFSAVTVVGSIVLPFGVLPLENRKTSSGLPFRIPRVVIRVLRRLAFRRPDLLTAWKISHMLFAGTMIFAPLARSVRFATFLVAACGIPWSLTAWAPFAFMGVEINRLATPSGTTSSTRPARVTMITGSRHGGITYFPVDAADINNTDLEMDDHSSVLRLNHHLEGDSDTESDFDDDEATSTGELAGIYLGVLNVYTTLPQFVGTFISLIVFSILEPGKSPAPGGTPPDEKHAGHEWMNLNGSGPNPIAVCLFIGAVSALIAVEATRRMSRTR